LEQGLALLDHAQLMTGTLFDGFQPLLEFNDLCRQHTITLQQLLVLALLLGNLLLELGNVGKTALADPESSTTFFPSTASNSDRAARSPLSSNPVATSIHSVR